MLPTVEETSTFVAQLKTSDAEPSSDWAALENPDSLGRRFLAEVFGDEDGL